MNNYIQRFNQIVNHPDLAKLLLRISFAAMFFLHGFFKATNPEALAKVGAIFESYGLPAIFANGIYLGQIVAPILIIIGFYTRIFAFVCVMTAANIIFLMHSSNFFTLSKLGAWTVEPIGTFFFGFVAIMLLGSGKYAVKAD